MSMGERAKAVQVVSGRLDQWARAFSNRDLDSLAAYYHHGPELSVIWPDGRRTAGWREESTTQREFLANAAHLSLTASDVTVDVVALDIAVAGFFAQRDLVVGARRSVCRGPGTSVWVRESGGEWRIRALQTACANSP